MVAATRQRVLSISRDDDLMTHFERLSDDAVFESDLMAYTGLNRAAERAMAANLELSTGAAGDAVNLPMHYARFKIEPIRFIEENNIPFLPGNVIKYTCRYDAKNGIEDLEKAKRCLELMIAKLKGDPDWWKRKVGVAA